MSDWKNDYIHRLEEICEEDKREMILEYLENYSHLNPTERERGRGEIERIIYKKNKFGENLLCFFSCIGHKQIVSNLLSLGANIESRDSAGRTPLLNALHCGHHEVVSILLNHGANIESHDPRERTALMFASLVGAKEVVSLLLSKGANIESRDYKGRTSLVMASRYGHQEVVSLLLSCGANIQAQGDSDSERYTSLMYASQEGHHELVSILLNQGANIEVQDLRRRTCLTIASECRRRKVVSILLSHGAQIESSLMIDSSPEILSLLSSFQRWRERRNFLTLLTQLTLSPQSPLNHNLNGLNIVMNLEEMKREIVYFL